MSMLVQQKYIVYGLSYVKQTQQSLCMNFVRRRSSATLGNVKLNWSWHYFTITVSYVLNSFLNSRLLTKSNAWVWAFVWGTMSVGQFLQRPINNQDNYKVHKVWVDGDTKLTKRLPHRHTAQLTGPAASAWCLAKESEVISAALLAKWLRSRTELFPFNWYVLASFWRCDSAFYAISLSIVVFFLNFHSFIHSFIKLIRVLVPYNNEEDRQARYILHYFL